MTQPDFSELSNFIFASSRRDSGASISSLVAMYAGRCLMLQANVLRISNYLETLPQKNMILVNWRLAFVNRDLETRAVFENDHAVAELLIIYYFLPTLVLIC